MSIIAAIFLVPPVSSPSVGERSQVMIPVPVEATSGFISFAAQSLQVYMLLVCVAAQSHVASVCGSSVTDMLLVYVACPTGHSV